MDIKKPKAVIGTNSWGGAVAAKVFRGSSVDDQTLKDTIAAAKEKGLLIFDLAQVYGLGKAQKKIGAFGTEGIIISAKFTPPSKYTPEQVRKSLERDLAEFKRGYVDIYWLHRPVDTEKNLAEMIELYHEEKIHYIGVSNFSLEECKQAKAFLDSAGVPLYGVQNHYSLLDRKWEEEGVLGWCHENDILYWGWAVLEEGLLTDPRIKKQASITKLMMNGKKEKLTLLYEQMEKVAKNHHITIPQVAIAFCAAKGVVPICGCRKPYQVEQLHEAVNTVLTNQEIQLLQEEADRANVKIFK
ncbi:oxidoreductase, aldo/keto reductase family protein [Marvinbryantia formatexigens DSM 14469]|uniref:Oxidoreductase, aldo/keto reductase family protein n=1 Tax=Marvinbryantia formatexigens DSM 14469 TaxID=478749 RepID=C6LHU5_9FIRM|nr:aldo/keto reductase [Marvinbryantia formatexigens]EET59835.1 oxidoreductase, aldo/keto reductase family protein [Marvinbryantia formatexigens DSM 14469]UWO23307.1 aldo/keto reductase [Marvinbryantia formatexigens DSM 14469]